MRSGSETASTPTSTVSDPHLSMIRQAYPQTPNGCEECLRLGTEWVHVRPYLTCGHVGCCDSSPLRHASARIENYLGFSASQAEALLCAGDPVAVVGGGNSAGQAAGAMAIRLAFERTRPG